MASLRKPPFVKVHFNSVVWITFYKPKELFSTENNLLCNKKAPRMLKVLHGIIHTLKKSNFLECTRETKWMDTDRAALWSSRRKIPLSTSCVQEIIMTDVTFTAVQLQAACLGTRGRSWQKISIKRNRTYPNTFLHLQLCAPWSAQKLSVYVYVSYTEKTTAVFDLQEWFTV